MPAATLTAEFDRLIQFGPARYPYYLRIRDDAGTLRALLADMDADRFVLVTDTNVPARHVARIRGRLTAVAPVTVLALTPASTRKRSPQCRISPKPRSGPG